MKKIFSTVAMAVVAMAAVVSMSSCQNDSPSSFNAAPQMPATTTTTTQQTTTQSTSSNTNQKKSYTYKLSLSNDILALFDVQTTVTAGSESKTYTSADFSNNTTIVYNYGFGQEEYAGKAVNPFTVLADNAEAVQAKTTVTLKSNWKEILDGMCKEQYDFYYQTGVGHTMTVGFSQKAKGCTETYLNRLAGSLSEHLSD